MWCVSSFGGSSGMLCAGSCLGELDDDASKVFLGLVAGEDFPESSTPSWRINMYWVYHYLYR